jgi:flagellar biosynthesis regulator FlbT
MAKTSQTKAFIRKGEVFFLNGALIRAQDSFSMEIMLADTFLLPSQIVSEETATSDLQKAYYYAQQMMIEPRRKDDWQNRLEGCVVKLPSATQKKIWRACQERNLQKVLTTIRSELKKDVASIN